MTDLSTNLAAIRDLDLSTLPPEMMEALLEGVRRTLRANFIDWCRLVLSPQNQEPARHHKLIIEALQDVADGRCRRLMIFLPPGSAKSTYASVLFPTWFLARRRNALVVAASHTADLAKDFGRKARDIIVQHGARIGVALAGDGTAAGSWRIQGGGEYYAVGVEGALSGRRADVLLIDDPVDRDGNTETKRENVWMWYNRVALTRLRPGGSVIIVMTRWNQDDIAGRLLDTELEDWRVIKIPAIAVDADDPLGRKPGELLWGDDPRYDYASDVLKARERSEKTGDRQGFEALYQQNPLPAGGTLFKVGLLGTLDALPAGCKLVRAWDLAATKKLGTRDPDWTVGALLAKTPQDAWVIVDVVRLRGGPEEVEQTIVATAQRDGRGVRISLPQDPGQSGKMQVLYLTKKLAGWRVDSSPETGDKVTRAAPFASQVNVGNVSMLRGAWNRPMIEELGGFPNGSHDDQVDALSRAFAGLMAPPKPARAIRFHFMGR